MTPIIDHIIQNAAREIDQQFEKQIKDRIKACGVDPETIDKSRLTLILSGNYRELRLDDKCIAHWNHVYEFEHSEDQTKLTIKYNS